MSLIDENALVRNARLTDEEIQHRTSGEGYVNFYNTYWEEGVSDNALRHLANVATDKALWVCVDWLEAQYDERPFINHSLDLEIAWSALRGMLEVQNIERPQEASHDQA